MIEKFKKFFISGNKQRVKHIPVIGRRSGGDEIADHRASARRRRSVFEFSRSLRFHRERERERERESLTDE